MSKSTNKPIKYICFYSNNAYPVKRLYAPSATNKIDYIVSAINKIGYNVDIISVSPVIDSKIKYHKSDRIKLGSNTVNFFASFGGDNVLIKILRNLWHYLLLMCYLLFQVKTGETIIAYHSLRYRYAFVIAKKIKRFRLIYEVEELYSDVTTTKAFNTRKREMTMISTADAYIFPTELLNEKINCNGKPHIIIYGSYTINEKTCEKIDDGVIHVIYAGTFDNRKGGAAAAAAAAEFLPDNYHVHICGFGSDNDIQKIIDVVNTTSKIAKARISYDGLKLGQEYINFMQMCDIGLSTQDPHAAFNNTSFPSKILSYMSNGLSVVSIDIPTIRQSKIGRYISFYSSQDAQSIANAIISSNHHNNNIDVIKDLDNIFTAELSQLIDKRD